MSIIDKANIESLTLIEHSWLKFAQAILLILAVIKH